MKIRDETGARADEEFGTLSLGDLPRDRRAKELLKRFAGWPTGSILGGAKAGSRRWRYIVLGAMNASTGDIAVASPETNLLPPALREPNTGTHTPHKKRHDIDGIAEQASSLRMNFLSFFGGLFVR
jgi:hypothetical protein